MKRRLFLINCFCTQIIIVFDVMWSVERVIVLYPSSVDTAARI